MPKTFVAYNMIKKENKGVFMDYDVYVACCDSEDVICGCEDTAVCDGCGKLPPRVDYKDGAYCNWYCAKKGSK